MNDCIFSEKMDNSDALNGLTASPLCKRARRALSPVSNLDLSGRFLTPKSSCGKQRTVSLLSPNDRSEDSVFQEVSPKLVVDQFRTPTHSNSEAEVLGSPLKRELQAHGIGSYNKNPKKLGKGAYGTVVLGLWQGQKVAVKLIRNENKFAELSRELNAMSLRHPNIVKVLTSFESQNDESPSLLVMEYVGRASMLNIIQEERFDLINQDFVNRSLIQIARALVHCHANDILHLDVKPANVLVTRHGVCKLADFGCSRTLAEVKKESRQKKLYGESFIVGTPGYIAPELFRNTEPSYKCDVYSYGILMWQLLAKQSVPYPGLHIHSIMFKVVSESFRPDESLVGDVSQKLKDLYRLCWSQDPAVRPSMQAVLRQLSSEPPASDKSRKRRGIVKSLR